MWERIKSWRWAIVIAMLLMGGLAYSFWPEAEAVDLGTVSKGSMEVGLTDDGVTRVHELYTVTAPVTGYLTRIELEPGDQVIAGRTVIARMAGIPSQPLDQRSRVEIGNAIVASKAGEASASAALKLAEADLGRAEALAERGFLSRADLDARRAAASSARSEVARNRAETRRLRSLLTEPAASGTPSGGAIAVRSPESGVVLRRLVESEGVVGQGAALVEIGDPARIEVVADLLSREAAQIAPGYAVKITRWGGEGALPGRVRRIEPFGQLKISALGIEEQRVNVIIDFAPEAAEQIARLGHGYQVDATVILWQSPDVLRVPVGALFRGNDGSWQVFVEEGGRAHLRAISIGQLNEDFGEVLEGLEPNQQVVLNPSGNIEDGTKIATRD
ncbi:HlyD family efflux transporter periplasmic adaptor subunit [Pontixanthobacter gangjinensis]|uniref:Efflux RND transporter periplasmic adaptor subunit n=1 Tax=Pontixanthobacter gangjinensis TaxID=1028742 RepID=A0A6I4SMZ4_9SPHN|nr:efflux RND transporter periplasmic adaptor subunit [Pontixanthobacter gangjinensis]MXO57271.1 efflux RND transporter periplasmic adaptor subunit [Pontixanthobacter gangjinensis]